MQQQRAQTARSWTFTSYAEELTWPLLEKVRYYIYQREVAPETGREHWQGYVQLKSPCRMTGVKKIIGDDAVHLEISRGSPDQNYAYCTKLESRKEGTEPHEYGERAVQGQR